MTRFSRQYLYQLPWYVIIGAPGAGKTTALVNSGLHFPLADRFGKTARGVGASRLVVYQRRRAARHRRPLYHQKAREEDAGEWRSFVALLKNTAPASRSTA